MHRVFKHACPGRVAQILCPSCILRTNSIPCIPCNRAACQARGRGVRKVRLGDIWLLGWWCDGRCEWKRLDMANQRGAKGVGASLVLLSCCSRVALCHPKTVFCVCVPSLTRMRVGSHLTVRAGLVHRRLALGVYARVRACVGQCAHVVLRVALAPRYTAKALMHQRHLTSDAVLCRTARRTSGKSWSVSLRSILATATSLVRLYTPLVCACMRARAYRSVPALGAAGRRCLACAVCCGGACDVMCCHACRVFSRAGVKSIADDAENRDDFNTLQVSCVPAYVQRRPCASSVCVCVCVTDPALAVKSLRVRPCTPPTHARTHWSASQDPRASCRPPCGYAAHLHAVSC